MSDVRTGNKVGVTGEKERTMFYSKDGKYIHISMVDVIGGKKPGLYIGEGNEFIKVGNFASEEKAKLFEERLEYMFGKNLIRDGRTTKE